MNDLSPQLSPQLPTPMRGAAAIRFPNLFIIGAMKAGTSSLHEYLHQHPDIFMSRMKEPQYFAPHTTRWGHAWGQGHRYPEPGMDWYLRLFEGAGGCAYAGESSVSYTARPWVSNCEQRIYQFNPDARLIYLLRDPVQRALSHYWHFVANGREDRRPLAALRGEEEYVARSNYALQLRPYLNRFGPEPIYVLTLEQLAAHPDTTLKQLFRWLGVAPDVTIDTTHRLNVQAEAIYQIRRHLVLVDRLLKHWRWKRWKRRVPKFVPLLLHRMAYRPVRPREVDLQDAVAYLRARLEPSMHELAQLLGRNFPEWSLNKK